LPLPLKREEWTVSFYERLMAGERVADTMHSVQAIFESRLALLLPPTPKTY
jgi:hypothetical protein